MPLPEHRVYVAIMLISACIYAALPIGYTCEDLGMLGNKQSAES